MKERQRRRLALLISLVCFLGNGIIVTTACGAITRQQVVNLIAAAQKLPPESMDITYYESFQDHTKSEQELREEYEKVASEMFKESRATPEKRNEFIELNVKSRLKNQQEGRKTKYRVRYDKNRQRIDNVSGIPSLTSSVPVKALDANTPYDMTSIEITDDSNVNRRFEYSHEGKAMWVQTIKDRGRFSESSDIPTLMTMPGGPIKVVKKIIGDVGKDGLWDPNETKINRLCSHDSEETTVVIEADKESPETKVKIEAIYYNKRQKPFAKMALICDKENYSKVYEYEYSGFKMDNPVGTETRSDFDPQGFPHKVVSIKYGDKGEIKYHKTYQIENVQINLSIPEDVFNFDSKGYKLIEQPN